MKPHKTPEEIAAILSSYGVASRVETVEQLSYVVVLNRYEDAAFAVQADGTVIGSQFAMRFGGSLRSRKIRNEVELHDRCKAITDIVARDAKVRAEAKIATAVADELKKLSMVAVAVSGRVEITLSFTPEHARKYGPKIAAVLAAKDTEEAL
jgi:hypothetical protein